MHRTGGHRRRLDADTKRLTVATLLEQAPARRQLTATYESLRCSKVAPVGQPVAGQHEALGLAGAPPPQPPQPDTAQILRGLQPYYERQRGGRYSLEALKTAVERSARYIHDRKLPDKAIDVIDEVGAAQMLLPEHKRRKVISVKDVEAIVAMIARIPPKTVSSTDKESLRNLDRDLKSVVFGQDKAIDTLASAIKLSRAGLREPEKPNGN